MKLLVILEILGGYFPYDLDFFIEFERRDRERRSGSLLPRQLPTAADYRQHQIDNGLITANELGGRYSRYSLRPFVSRAFSEPLQGLLSLDRSWHGAPMAALRRAITALGSLYIDKIPDGIVGRLVELRKLYMINEPELPSDQPSASGHPPPGGDGRGG